MIGIVLALGCAIAGGFGDFLGGTTSRRIGTAPFMFATQALGLVLAGCWVVGSGQGPPSLSRLAIAGAAGLGLTVSLAAIFEAMVLGAISIVAPIGATGVAIPVTAAVIGGEQPTFLQFGGIVATVAGIALVSRNADKCSADRGVPGIVLAGVAALGGGTFLWLMAPASRHGVAWALLVARGVPFVAVALVISLRRLPLRRAFKGESIRSTAWSATLAFLALVLYALATRQGQLALVSVLASLYPVITVGLAYRVAGERLRRWQQVGIAMVIAGVGLLAT